VSAFEPKSARVIAPLVSLAEVARIFTVVPTSPGGYHCGCVLEPVDDVTFRWVAVCLDHRAQRPQGGLR